MAGWARVKPGGPTGFVVRRRLEEGEGPINFIGVARSSIPSSSVARILVAVSRRLLVKPRAPVSAQWAPALSAALNVLDPHCLRDVAQALPVDPVVPPQGLHHFKKPPNSPSTPSRG